MSDCCNVCGLPPAVADATEVQTATSHCWIHRSATCMSRGYALQLACTKAMEARADALSCAHLDCVADAAVAAQEVQSAQAAARAAEAERDEARRILFAIEAEVGAGCLDAIPDDMRALRLERDALNARLTREVDDYGHRVAELIAARVDLLATERERDEARALAGAARTALVDGHMRACDREDCPHCAAAGAIDVEWEPRP